MPLSRHFYDLDEVQSALLYTTSRNQQQDSLFWCKELLLSGCISETISVLFRSWLWNTGAMRLEWLIDAWNTLASNELSEDNILLSTYNLASTERDNSLWNILILTIQDPQKMPDRISNKFPIGITTNNIYEKYFIGALYQGKARSAWWISQYIDDTITWDLLVQFINNVHTSNKQKYLICIDALKNYEQLLGYTSPEYDIIIRCCAVIIVCINKKKQDCSFKEFVKEFDKYDLQFLEELNSNIGTKRRRSRKIPKDCLYGTTVRGISKWSQNTYAQLNNFEKHLFGCPYWDDILLKYSTNNNGNIVWLSCDLQESFYNEYFPDDIPDEWNKNDKNISHGDGILAPTELPSIYKYSRNFMSKMPYFAWGTVKTVNKFLESLIDTDCNVENVLKYYVRPTTLSKEDLKKLEPVKKILVYKSS